MLPLRHLDMQLLITESKSPEEITGGRPSEQCQITLMTLGSLQTSSHRDNLGISRANARWQALTQPEVQPFIRHFLLAPHADFRGSPNRKGNQDFPFCLCPTSRTASKKRLKKFSLKKPSGNRSLISSPAFPHRARCTLLGEQQATGSSLLPSWSQATVLRCFRGKLPAQGWN